METKPSKTPWTIIEGESGYNTCIENDSRLIARVHTSDTLQDEINTAFIVRAVNNHEEFKKHMQSAAVMLRAIADQAHEPMKDNCKWQAERLEEAIAKAEGH